MEKVRFGIVGIGNMGSCHAKNLYEGVIEHGSLTAICDIEPQKLDWAKENLPNVKLYSDYKEMILSGEIDAVMVATPHYLHPEIGTFALQNGVHALCEKPAGVYTKQVAEINEIAKQSDLVYGLMFNQRTSKVYQKIRALVQQKEIGELRRFVWIITNWYRTQSYYDSGSWRATWAGEGGGVLVNQCPHNLDLWQWITGMPKSVKATCKYGYWHDIEVEDEVTAYVEYENKATGVFITTTGEFPGTNRMEISGTKGKILLEDGKIKLWRLKTDLNEDIKHNPMGFAQIEHDYEEIDIEETGGQHNEILENFSQAVLFGTPLLADGTEGIFGLTLSNAIHLSDWLGEEVSLPLDHEVFLTKLEERAAHSQLKEGIVSKINDLHGSQNDRWNTRF